MAIRHANAQIRSVHRQQALDAVADIASTQPGPAELAADAADWDTCLHLLPRPFRRALMLWRNGHTVPEVALMLHLGPRTVERVIKRARDWWAARGGSESWLMCRGDTRTAT